MHSITSVWLASLGPLLTSGVVTKSTQPYKDPKMCVTVPDQVGVLLAFDIEELDPTHQANKLSNKQV
jgi:hypothetical protein